MIEKIKLIIDGNLAKDAEVSEKYTYSILKTNLWCNYIVIIEFVKFRKKASCFQRNLLSHNMLSDNMFYANMIPSETTYKKTFYCIRLLHFIAGWYDNMLQYMIKYGIYAIR
jgi:hypothetical protein